MIQVFAVNMSEAEHLFTFFYEKASQQRRTRADSCHNQQSSLCCLAAEALLRYGIKMVYDIEEYTIETNAYGKPRFSDNEEIHFNLSHSGPWVVLALGDSEVGIDVQAGEVGAKEETVARRFFSPAEQQYVFQPGQDWKKCFLQIWTQKESFIKYLGTGLQKPLTSFCVCSMEKPGFITHWLGGDCMSLCAEDPEYSVMVLSPEQLL